LKDGRDFFINLQEIDGKNYRIWYAKSKFREKGELT